MLNRFKKWNHSIFESARNRKIYMGICIALIVFCCIWFLYAGSIYGYVSVIYTIPLIILFMINIRNIKRIDDSKKDEK